MSPSLTTRFWAGEEAQTAKAQSGLARERVASEVTPWSGGLWNGTGFNGAWGVDFRWGGSWVGLHSLSRPRILDTFAAVSLWLWSLILRFLPMSLLVRNTMGDAWTVGHSRTPDGLLGETYLSDAGAWHFEGERPLLCVRWWCNGRKSRVDNIRRSRFISGGGCLGRCLLWDIVSIFGAC